MHRAWPTVAPPPPVTAPPPGGGDGGTPHIIAWATPGTDPDGTIVAGAQGSLYSYGAGLGQYLYAGVVGYTTGTVIWTMTPESLDEDQISTPPSVFEELPNGRVKIRIADRLGITEPPIYRYWKGIGHLTATVNGIACQYAIEYGAGDAFYGTVAWAPEASAPAPSPAPGYGYGY